MELTVVSLRGENFNCYTQVELFKCVSYFYTPLKHFVLQISQVINLAKWREHFVLAATFSGHWEQVTSIETGLLMDEQVDLEHAVQPIN